MSDSRVRVWTDTAVLLITAVAAATQVLPGGNGLRVVASLLAAALLPGAAVLTRFHVDDFPTWLGLACGLSFAFEAIFASGALWLHQWRPGLVIALLAVPSVVVVAADLLSYRRAERERLEAEEQWR